MLKRLKHLTTKSLVLMMVGGFALSNTLPAYGATNSIPARRMENINRGVTAMYTGGKNAFISWRMLGTDSNDIAFNIYKKTGTGKDVLLNTSGKITSKTNWTDNSLDNTKTNVYTVKAVTSGKEESMGESFSLPANGTAKQYLPIKLQPIKDSKGNAISTYSVLHTYVGDLDGDKQYEFVVKRCDDSTERRPIILDAYKLDGTLLWRINLGTNIETGNSSATAPVLVADFNSDGKAEVMMKTSEGTTFGDRTTIGDVNKDGKTDYNSHKSTDMYQVLSGPEYISMVDGKTGKELDRTDFIPRGQVSDWGDNYGNRMNFIFATVAYLDGVNPSIVLSRGPGGMINKQALTAQALNFTNGKFQKLWTFKVKDYENKLASGQLLSDFHAIRAVDLNGDGKDEISWGPFAVKSDGNLMYSTELTHGDRFAIADIDPSRPGLECYAIQQLNPTKLGAAIYDAGTGKIIKKYYVDSVQDVGRGDAASVLPNIKGMQTWNSSLQGFYDGKGNKLTNASPFPSLSIWWDGDLLRESLDGIGKNGCSPAINKVNPKSYGLDRVYTIYNEGVKMPYGGRVALYGDILGDWREEVMLESNDGSELRIYTTTIPTEYRIPTLMHDPAYRNCVNVKGYLQSTQTDYYLGANMDYPVKQPNIVVR